MSVKNTIDMIGLLIWFAALVWYFLCVNDEFGLLHGPQRMIRRDSLPISHETLLFSLNKSFLEMFQTIDKGLLLQKSLLNKIKWYISCSAIGWRTKDWTVWKQMSSISMQKKAQCRNTLHPMFTACLNKSVCWYINNSLEVTNPKSINSRRRLAGYFKSFSNQVWWSARLEDFKVTLSKWLTMKASEKWKISL